ncbi:hypothetical protein PInf_011074 [Phytophthora infestans]|nr:hypothetical protein PInf_011074 [Phytophthora infestans]
MGLTSRLKDHRGRDYAVSSHVKSSRTEFIPAPMQESDELDAENKLNAALKDDELLKRAREAHTSIDFGSLAAAPETSGEWKRVESVDGFAVFRRLATMSNNGKQRDGLEVMCIGRVDASVEEIASILRSSSEAEHNTVMSGLYAKSFIFGSYEREVACSENQDEDDDDDVDNDEQLAVKTKSFSRTTILGHNEQWCYFDYFQRTKEHGGFTISKRALPPSEGTPGRIAGDHSRVDQLHGLNASYLVDKIPNQKELRVVFHAWFEMSEEEVQEYYSRKRKGSRRRSYETTRSQDSASAFQRSKSFDQGDNIKYRSQLRRLLAMAHGVTKLPTVVRRRRFGAQVPVDVNTVHVSNTRCPCCTHSLKLSLAMAASAITTLNLGSLKSNTKRCYLCGYLVCVDCWNSETMECSAGRVAAIVVCTRCRANVQACEYSEVFAGTSAQREKHRGPPRVVEDSSNAPTVSLLVDFLSASLLNSDAGSSEHAAVMTVIRTLLRQDSEDSEDDSDDDCSDEDRSEFDRNEPRFKILGETDAVEKISQVLSDKEHLPPLEECKLGNAAERNYVLDLPVDPKAAVPLSPIPSNEADRIASSKASGILQLAGILAPKEKNEDAKSDDKPDIQDLELLCSLAVKTMGCSYSFVTVMGETDEHVLASTHPDFAGAVVPREQTTCQHLLMSPHPFMVAHHEADVRFQNHGPTSSIPIRFYVGFPVKVPLVGGKPGDPEMIAATLCCVDTKPRVRGIFETNKPRHGWGSSQSSESSRKQSRSQQSNDLEQEFDEAILYKLPSDTDMLQRARESHTNVDFEALSTGPEKGGPWQRVETTGEFIVFKRPPSADTKDNRLPGLEVMCVGQLDASAEEVASVFRSNSDVDHANTMEGLYSKTFIFGSLDREVPCSGNSQNQDDDSNANSNEQLNVKTTSFLRSTLFGRNEQWCFSDYLLRLEESDGFRITQCALPPFEPTPGRVVGENARVDQLHGLNASYVVDQLPDDKGLRVVYNAWFEDLVKDIEATTSSSDASLSSRSAGLSVTPSQPELTKPKQ